MFSENLKIALRAITANKMRSILTVLGVMIGVAAVIAVVSLVQGMQYKISADLRDIGSNYIEVFPDPGEQRNPFLQKMPDLTVDDAEAVRKGTTAIHQFTPIFLRQVETKYGDTRHSTQMMGVNDAYQDVLNHWVDHGRFFTSLDEETKKRVCVIGPEAAKSLRMGSDPIGKQIEIEGNAFTVVGVFERKGGNFGNNPDEFIAIPFATAAAIYGSENMKKIIIAFQMQAGSDLDLARDQVKTVLRTRHHLKKGDADDFRILAQEEIVKTVSSVLTYITAIMGSVVGIALLVGGIGIMNIMLVSVTERTREIGLRMAVGASDRDILLQFLVEAVTLAVIGGAVGVAAGLAGSRAISYFAEWRTLVMPDTIAVAFGFAAAIGIFFGFYPARKAARLDPIEALRYE